MERSTTPAWVWLLLLSGCSEVADVQQIPCEPGCKDETTRVYCDAAGKAQTEVCPASPEPCAASVCQAGACTHEPAVGAPCGETGAAQCNEGYACLGPDLQLSAIRHTTCLTADDGKVWCWGTNQFRKLGDGTEAFGAHPVLVQGLPEAAAQVTAGYAHTCALGQSGQIYCWGNNTAGQCGVAAVPEPLSEPALVAAPGVRFTHVEAGQGHTCAIAQDKTVYCWGVTLHGQCGVEPAVAGNFVLPTRVPGLNSVESISTVKNHTCAVRSADPAMVCWGSNTHVDPPSTQTPHVNFKLGPSAGDLAYSAAPVPVVLDARIIGVGMGYESTYALTEHGEVYAWGRGKGGQLGIESAPSDTPVATPAKVMIETNSGLAPLAGVASINRSDGSDQCVTLRDGSLLCWGGDDWGEVGAGTEEGARTLHRYPIPVRALPGPGEKLVRGEDHGCAVVAMTNGHELWCFGRPGLLGNGVTERAPDGELPSQWEAVPVIWKPENFAPALAPAGEP